MVGFLLKGKTFWDVSGLMRQIFHLLFYNIKTEPLTFTCYDIILTNAILEMFASIEKKTGDTCEPGRLQHRRLGETLTQPFKLEFKA